MNTMQIQLQPQLNKCVCIYIGLCECVFVMYEYNEYIAYDCVNVSMYVDLNVANE
jgi:hypothetical protein